ncbi:MAG: hypothetical protein CMG66_00785 [Candidatus Marinimicrobia bacterium]|nr:hypothetical protein [Candidatus Neomarinimicrobiota bacterium]|tara:strand:- start:7681 stop:12405 length:4725 start_codon:yes stop_codon:yes gene_type:complete
MLYTICLSVLLSFSYLFSQIIYEEGSLRGFISGECSNCLYDNYISHISEGIASEGYNIYPPDSIDIQTNGFGNYQIIPPESETLNYWNSIFTHFINNDFNQVNEMLLDSTNSFNYDIVEFSDTVYNKTYYLLRENLDSTYYDSNLEGTDLDDVYGSFNNGWGLYIINPTAINKQVVVQVPHPNDDFISPYVSLDLFFEIDAFAYLLSGAGREVKWTNQGNYTNDKSLSDPSRNTNTVFHEFHKVLCDSLINIGPHSPIVLHMHSFDENQSHEGFNSIILSGGHDAAYANKPIRDVSNEHLDIVNFTDEEPITSNYFSYLGINETVRVDQYYQAHYDSIFHFHGQDDSYEIPHAYELLGPHNAVQMLYLRNYFDNREVYEPWIQIELDEIPEIFNQANINIYQLYDNNYMIIRDYYRPFIQATKRYLNNWRTYIDSTPPETIQDLTTSFDGAHYVKLDWTPTDDTNFKSYRIYIDQDSITDQSYFWDENNLDDLIDIRTNESTVYNLNTDNDYLFSIKSIDHFGNISEFSNTTTNNVTGHSENIIIQNFDTDNLDLSSFPNHDQNPESWSIDTVNTFYDSYGSLKLFGNTWKVEEINNQQIDEGTIWQISSFSEDTGEIIGLALQDSVNTLYYSFYGTQELDIEEWITVYQGAFPENEWNIFQLPIADDWFAYFDYYPLIEKVVYINDKDNNDVSSISYFDDLVDITNSIPYSPIVTIEYQIADTRRFINNRSITIDFSSIIEDNDSNSFSYLWYFGDGQSSTDPNPSHTYTIEDNHIYNVILQVTDNNGYIGFDTEPITLEYGLSSLPITMNFVGDIMLGRKYENNGGIIDQYGVEYIFEHTREYLGEQADITVANLECPLTVDGTPHPTKSVVFKADPSSIQGLIYAGIDIVSLANNHTIDYGLEGLINTQNILDEHNILYSGAGSNSYEAYKPLIFNSHGLNIAFLASCDRTGQYNNAQPYLNAGYNKPGFAYMTPYYLLQQIEAVDDIADFIIVEMHAGSEYSTSPGQDYDNIILDNIETNNYIAPDEIVELMDIPDFSNEDENYSLFLDVPHMWDREIRHFAIDNGADLVIVHHPHIIQGFEVYNGKLIAHSLGNFVFDLSYPETFPSVILNSSIDTLNIYDFNIDPVYIDENIPYIAEGKLGLHILDYLAFKSKELGTYIDVNRLDHKGYVILDSTNISEKHIISKNSISFYSENSYYYSNPIKIHNFGSFSSVDSLSNDYEYRVGKELIWFGNMENEGCTLWNLNNDDEYYDSSDPYEGEQSICLNRNINSSDNIITNFQHRLRIKNDLNHGLLANIKSENATGANIQIKYYSSRSSSISLGTDSFDEDINGDSNWSTIYSDINPRDGSYFFDTRLNLEVPESDSSKACFDDVSVIEWSEWTNINDYENLLVPNDYYFVQIKTPNSPNINNLIHTEISYSNNLPMVNPDFSIIQSDYINPSSVIFENESTGNIGWFLWNFGDGNTSIEENPTHEYTTNGPHTVTLTILDYNGNPISKTIENLISFNNNMIDGDLNFDQEIDILDVIVMINLILNNISDYSGILSEVSDLDNNGSIDIIDVVSLVNLIL